MKESLMLLFVILLSFQLSKADSVNQSKTSAQFERAPQADIEVASTWIEYHIYKNEIVKAEARLQKEMNKYPNEPEYFRLKAFLAATKGNYSEAENLYNKASESGDDLVSGKSLYELARMQSTNNKKDAAEQTLKTLEKDPAFALGAQKAQKSLKNNSTFPMLDEEKAENYIKRRQSSLGVQASVASGYDSNAALLPDAAAVKQGSSYIRPSIVVSKQTSLAKAPLLLEVDLSYNHNLDENVDGLDNLSLNVSESWELPNRLGWSNNISVQNATQLTWVKEPNNNFYLGSNTFSFLKTINYHDKDSFNIQLPITYAVYPGANAQNENVRDGFSAGLQFSNTNQVNRWKWNQRLGATKGFARGDNYRSQSVNGGISAEIEVANKIKTLFSLGSDSTNYPDSFNDRKDISYSASAGVSGPLKFWKSTNASLDFSYLKTNSNDINAQNQKNVVTLKVSHDL